MLLVALGVGLPYLDPHVADGLDAATAINDASDPRRNQRQTRCLWAPCYVAPCVNDPSRHTQRLAGATVGRSLFNVKVTYGIALLVVRIKRL